MSDKAYLDKNGFLYKKKFFSNEEVEKLLNINNKLHNSNNSKFGPLHNSKDAWDIIVNDRIISLIKDVLGSEKIAYLYHGHSVNQSKETHFDNAWHRDNTCRTFDKGPDWEKDYNVLRVAIYLDNGSSGLNLIKKSHRKKKYICRILNVLRTKFKFIYYNRLFRFFFDNIFGKKIHTNSGDCILFFANTLHSAINNKKDGNIIRRAFFLTYGTDNIHSQNHMNYYLFHRVNEGFGFIESEKNELFNLLEKKNIRINPPQKKKEIEFMSI